MDELLIKLKEEFERRKTVNPRYSLRGYARSLGIDQSLLVRIFKGERQISAELRERLKPQFDE